MTPPANNEGWSHLRRPALIVSRLAGLALAFTVTQSALAPVEIVSTEPHARQERQGSGRRASLVLGEGGITLQWNLSGRGALRDTGPFPHQFEDAKWAAPAPERTGAASKAPLSISASFR